LLIIFAKKEGTKADQYCGLVNSQTPKIKKIREIPEMK